MALRTVCSLQPMRRAIRVVGSPCALARSIWLRRTVKPWDDRRPASSSVCSFSVRGRTNSGACIPSYCITCPTALFGFALGVKAFRENILRIGKDLILGRSLHLGSNEQMPVARGGEDH